MTTEILVAPFGSKQRRPSSEPVPVTAAEAKALNGWADSLGLPVRIAPGDKVKPNMSKNTEPDMKADDPY